MPRGDLSVIVPVCLFQTASERSSVYPGRQKLGLATDIACGSPRSCTCGETTSLLRQSNSVAPALLVRRSPRVSVHNASQGRMQCGQRTGVNSGCGQGGVPKLVNRCIPSTHEHTNRIVTTVYIQNEAATYLTGELPTRVSCPHG